MLRGAQKAWYSSYRKDRSEITQIAEITEIAEIAAIAAMPQRSQRSQRCRVDIANLESTTVKILENTLGTRLETESLTEVILHDT
jgi:hypothetical protein